MNDLIISALLTQCYDAGDSAQKIGRAGQPLASLSADQLCEYIHPWYSTLQGPAVVLYDDLPADFITRCPKADFVRCEHDGSEQAWVARYRMLQRFLEDRTDIDRIFFTDINDVAFVSDPFAWLDGFNIQPMLAFGEDRSTFSNSWVVGQRAHLPPYIRDWYFRSPEGLLLNAGIWAGPRDQAITLVRALNEFFDKYEERSKPQVAWDMVLLSYAAYANFDHFATFKMEAVELPHNGAGLTLRRKAANAIEHCTVGSRVVADGNFDSTHGPPLSWHQIHGWCEVENFGRLYREAVERVKEPAVFVEVGTWLGRSAALMCEIIRKSKKPIKFYCVDTFKGVGDWQADVVRQNGGHLLHAWQQNLARTGNAGYAEPIEGDAAECASQFADGSIDFIFIDDDHSYEGCKRSIAAWKPKLKPNGWMAGHDYDFDGVRQAVIEEFPQHRTWETCWIDD